jgi:hypothetical protein
MRLSLSHCTIFACLSIFFSAPHTIPGMSDTAQAQSVQIGPGGVRITPDRDHRRDHRRDDWRISEREAVRIARRQGLVDVNRVARAGREWRVSGINRRGHRMNVIIDARSGRILRTVRMR